VGEARRKRLFGIGPTRLTPAVDIDAAIEDFEKYVEAGQVKGFVQIARLENVAPSVFPIKLWTFGLEKQAAYDMLCQMKEAMEKTMGFKDV
jgi:hypothetical protein